MDYGERTCLVCSAPFHATYAAQVCCGDECKRKRKAGQRSQYKRKWEAKARVCIREHEPLKAEVSRLTMRTIALEDALEEAQERVETVAIAGRCAATWHMEAEEKLKKIQSKLDWAEIELKRAREAEVDDAKTDVLTALKKKAKYCARMKLRATSLPCGKRKECFEDGLCENIPAGVKDDRM